MENENKIKINKLDMCMGNNSFFNAEECKKNST